MKRQNYKHNLIIFLTITVLAIFAVSVSAQVLPQVCMIKGTLGTTPPSGATGTMPNVVNRPGSATASCAGVTTPNPFNGAAGNYRYNVHYLKNPTSFPICVPVRLTKTNPSVSGADLQVSVFQAPFTATDITNSARFRGDAGISTGAFSLHQPTAFNVVVPGNSSVALIVYNNVNGSTAAEPYQLDFCTNTTNYSNAALTIPDNNPSGINATIQVPTSGRISDLNFRFTTGTGACDANAGNINAAVNHTFVGDLIFRLTAPNGFTSRIFMARRGGTRENICSMTIDDEGNLPELSTITSQNGQFVSGNFAPESTGRLSSFDSLNAQGTWTLNVSDNEAEDTGTLRRFALDITTYPQKAPFDYDGDQRSDISIFRPNGGEWWIQNSSNNVTFAAQFGTSSDKIIPGDYTGDGITDIAFWRPSTGQWFILRSEDFSFYAFPFGATTDIPVPADYDGDTFTDAAVFRPSNNGWYILKSSGGVASSIFGSSGDKPVPADYDGDGKADIAIYRPSNGEWWIINSRNLLTTIISFGISTDKPVPADYTGDAQADLAIWRPSNGNWYILRSDGGGFYAFPFGANGDIPIPGDYDGDGKTDGAVFRPSNNGWYIQRSNGGISSQQFGLNGDLPTPNAFVP